MPAVWAVCAGWAAWGSSPAMGAEPAEDAGAEAPAEVSPAGDLAPEGVAAPAWEVAHWIARGPAAEAESPLWVVEIWATWCGPCHDTFEGLSRLQQQHGDRIRVVALSDDSDRAVRRFFHDHADQMRFAIATTDSDTVQRFLFGGFGGRGIPSVYVIDGDQVVWSGAPEALEPALLALLEPQVPASPSPQR